jgi:dienelactone hydrolase
MKAALGILLIVAAVPANAKCLKLAIIANESTLTAADGRSVPVTIIAPTKPGRYPLIAFSHGNFSAPSRYRAMLDPIAAAGYVIVAPMHVDSELMPRDKPPSQQHVWQTRNEDFELALAASPANVDPKRRAAMGHSYGALNAQIAAGATPANAPAKPKIPPQTLVAWSPPGPFAGMIEAKDWSTISTPSLTITGTTDILPGFIEKWEVHRIPHDNTPKGKRWLWVGTGINHYFGGMFGREKEASPDEKRLFSRAISTTIAFLDKSLKRRSACPVGNLSAGEALEIDR